MTNPVHRLKKFVKYAGNEKPSYSYLTEASGWLGSGVKDKHGVEIFEGDIVKFGYGEIFTVTFEDGCFYARDNLLGDFHFPPEVVGHIAEEGET